MCRYGLIIGYIPAVLPLIFYYPGNFMIDHSARIPSKLLKASLICGLGFSLMACDLAKNQLQPDREANLAIQDYRDAFASRVDEAEEGGDNLRPGSGIPELQPYVASNSESMKSMPLVSISVNQSVPLRDILYELAQQADYDLELDPRIQGSIIFTARNRPFDEVVERISDVSGLRYRFNNDVLRVELDTPYNKLYKLDYLSYVRTNSSEISNDISVVSGEGADTGSNFTAASESEADFWGELENNLQQLLGAAPASLRTDTDPQITAVEQNPDVQAVAPADENGNVQVQPPDAVLRVESLPTSTGGRNSSRGGASAAAIQPATYSVNRQAGIINVYASEKDQKEIAAYLEELERSVTAQVLIEAKILEVSLNDSYSTGINWREFNPTGDLTTLNFLNSAGETTLDTLNPSTNLAGVGSSAFNIGYAGDNVEAFLNALSTFGTVRALASPRMTVINNQSAVLNVATNRVFFEIDLETEFDQDTNTRRTEIDSDIRSVPVGVIVNVQPSINLKNSTISMSVRPTITKIDDEVPDPSVAFVAQEAMVDIESLIPELNVQEIDSVIKLSSGDAVVMGGLLQDRIANNERSVPILGEIPMVGSLFKQHDDSITKTELVIFLRATILKNPSDNIHAVDKDFYRKFSSDRRPLKF